MPDPVTRTLKYAAGLREGGDVPGHDVLATYRSSGGSDVFALCRNGILLRQGAGWRSIAYDVRRRVHQQQAIRSA